MLKGYLDKYHKLAPPVKAGLWFTISGFLQKAISFVTMPIFTRLLNTEEFGAVTIFNSWENIFLLIVTLNVFFGAFNTAMMDFEEERDRYSSSLMGFISLTSIIWFIIYLLFRSPINYLTGMSFGLSCIMFFQIFFQGVVSIWLSRLKFSYDYIPVVIAVLILFGLSPILSIIGIELFPLHKVEAKLIGNALAYSMVGTYSAFYLFKKGRCIISKKYWKYAIKFSAPLIVHYLASVILGQADRIMISKFISDSAAAIYAVAYSVAMMLTILTTSANQAVVPWLFTSIKNNVLKQTRQSIYILLGSTIIALFFVMLIGPELIRILATNDYYDARWIIPPIVASLFFTFVYMLFANVEFYFKKTLYIVTASIAAAIVNIVLNYLFIPRYGYKAAAYTTLLCYILFALFHYLCARFIAKKEGLDWPFSINVIVMFMVALLSLTAVALFVYQYIIVRYVIIISLIILGASKYKTIMSFITQLKNKKE